MGMLYEYDGADRAIIDPPSHDDSIQQRCDWWASCYPQHTKVETTQ